MINQEKELIELIKAHVKESDFMPFNLVQAIIAKYPQILAEKVWEGESWMLNSHYDRSRITAHEQIWTKGFEPGLSKISIFIREVK